MNWLLAVAVLLVGLLLGVFVVLAIGYRRVIRDYMSNTDSRRE